MLLDKQNWVIVIFLDRNHSGTPHRVVVTNHGWCRPLETDVKPLLLSREEGNRMADRLGRSYTTTDFEVWDVERFNCALIQEVLST